MSDGRYFPSEEESEVLSKYISAYFNNPERSVQRAQVVQMVVQILSAGNKHWNQRTVRLWFNNNKKLLHSQSNPMLAQHPDVPQEFMYKGSSTFIPPRPLSVRTYPVQDQNFLFQSREVITPKPGFPTQVLIPSTVELPEPKEDTIGKVIIEEKSKFIEGQTPDEGEIEKRITDTIVSYRKQYWDEFILPQAGHKSIVSEQSMSATPNQDIDEPAEVIPFETIETSFIVDGLSPAIVTFTENEQRLICGDKFVALDLPTLATSMTFDYDFGAFWVCAGNRINAYKADTLELIKSVSARNHVSPVTALTYFNKSLYYGSGSNVLVYSSVDEERNLINFTETDELESSLGITTNFNEVSSITPLGNQIVVASTEHHTPYLLSSEGIQTAKFAGHLAGITCLSTLSTDSFISGSADQTARIWDKRDHTSVALLKHNGIVTSICSLGQIVFTGGTDGVVRQWDLRMNTPRFVGKCEGTPQSMHFSMDTGVLTVVTSQKMNEEFCNLCVFEDPAVVDGNSSNAVINFQL